MTNYQTSLNSFIEGKRHSQILGAANLGLIEKVHPDQIISDIKAHCPDKSLNEIRQAVFKASKEFKGNLSNLQDRGYRRHEAPKPQIDLTSYKNALIEGSINQLEDDIWDYELWELSPEKLKLDPRNDCRHLLYRLFNKTDILFIGDQYSKEVKTVSQWILDPKLNSYPHIIPNALTGEQGLTKDGKLSFRADSCVKDFKFITIEFDNMTLKEQAAFWMSMIRIEQAPVVCLIYSGSKSIHGWVKVNCKDADEWTAKVEQDLFPNYFGKLGVDSACKNEARLSRLPGHYRADKKQTQKLIFFNPDLIEVC